MEQDENRFTDDEIIRQLLQLGYENISAEMLRMFKEDLCRLQTTAEFEKEIRDSPAVATIPATLEISDETMDTKSPTSQTPRFRWQRTIPITIEKLLPGQEKTSSKKFEDISPYTPEASSYFGFGAGESISQKSSTQRIRKVLRHNNNGDLLVTSEIVNPGSNEDSSDSNLSIPMKFDDKDDNSVQLSDETTISKYAESKRSGSACGSKPPLQRYRYHRNSLLDACHGTQSVTGNLHLKTDRVALYHYYKDAWNKFTIPTKENHKQLRWNIRNKMLEKS